MATKKEKTKEQRIKTEKTRLKGIFKDLDENKRKLVTPLIEKAAFMSIELDDLQAKLEKDGWTSEYQNGQNQWGTKKSPEAETYIALSKNYAAVIKQLKILKKEVLYEFDLQIECLNPFWREEEETKEDIASWVAAWYFPCVIEKDSTKSMIYGYRAESVIVDCYNEGDVSTGMRIRFTALGTVSNPILLNVDTEEFIQINATMKTGDVIEINTKYGSKGAKLIRDGVETDYFRYIDVDSTFMQLAIGDNMFRYDAASGVNSLEVSIFYSKEFLGV